MSSTKKKVYGVVLSLAAVGFVIDSLINGEPQSTSAAMTELAVDSQGQSNADGADKSKSDGPLFPDNLIEMNWGYHSRNPFSLPERLARRRDLRLEGQETTPEQAPKSHEPPGMAQFVEKHRLKGVLVGHSVIIDDQMVRIGEQFDSCTLTKTVGQKAHFECRDGVAVMTVDFAHQ